MRAFPFLATLAAASALLVTPIEAQQRGCAVKPASFALNDAKKLSGAQLSALIPGKQIVFVRRPYNDQGHERRFVVFFRPDGSISSRCDRRAVGSSAWAECPSVDQNRTRGGREGGVWYVAGGTLCVGRLRNQDEVCYTLYRDGELYYVQLASGGPACMPGDVSIQ